MSRTGRTLGVVMVVLTASSIAACRTESNPADPYLAAATGLCEAAVKAAVGDIDGAETQFYDAAHQPLHDLAADASDIDRSVAARLLAAKEAVESGLDGDGSGMGDAFGSLVAATAEALTVTGHGPMPCTPGEAS